MEFCHELLILFDYFLAHLNELKIKSNILFKIKAKFNKKEKIYKEYIGIIENNYFQYFS